MVKSIVTFENLEGLVRYVKDNFNKEQCELTVYIVSDSEVRLFSELDNKGERDVFVCASNFRFAEVKSLGLKAVLDIREYLKLNLNEYLGIKIIA